MVIIWKPKRIKRHITKKEKTPPKSEYIKTVGEWKSKELTKTFISITKNASFFPSINKETIIAILEIPGFTPGIADEKVKSVSMYEKIIASAENTAQNATLLDFDIDFIPSLFY